MLKLVVSSGPLLTSTAVLVLAHGMLMTTVSLVIKQQGYSTSSMAFVLAAYNVGLALGAWFQGGLVKKYGHIRVYAGMAALLVNVTLLMFVVRHPLGWFLLRVAVGFAIAGLFVVIESWLSELATFGGRGVLLSLYTLISQGSLAAGQMVLTGYSMGSLELFAFMAAMFAFSLVPIVFTNNLQPTMSEDVRMGLRSFWKSTPLGGYGCFVSGIVQGSLLSVLPLFAANVGRSATEISYFMTAMLLGGLIAQWPIGLLSDRLGREWSLLMICSLFSFVAVAGVVLPLSSWYVLLAVGGLMGALGLAIYPVALALTHDVVEQEKITSATGTFLIVFGVGAVLGPFVGSYLLRAFGPVGLLSWLGGATGSLAIWSIIVTPCSPKRSYHCFFFGLERVA